MSNIPDRTTRLTFQLNNSKPSAGLRDIFRTERPEIAAGLGAGIGALGSGLGGYFLTEDPKKKRRNALIGAGLGGLAGGGIGWASSEHGLLNGPQFQHHLGDMELRDAFGSIEPDILRNARKTNNNSVLRDAYIQALLKRDTEAANVMRNFAN